MTSQRYVSHELTHFVGRGLRTDEERFALLRKILETGLLKVPGKSDVFTEVTKSGVATKVMQTMEIAYNKVLSSNEKYQSSVICFADIPVPDLALHMKKYSKFGISFSKPFLVAKGANPVFYVSSQTVTSILHPLYRNPEKHPLLMERARRAKNRGAWSNMTLSDLFDAAEQEYVERARLREVPTPGVETPPLESLGAQALATHLFPFMKFFDSDLDPDHDENYYMEREWRVVGPVQFRIGDIERVILPRPFASRLRLDFPKFEGQTTFAD